MRKNVTGQVMTQPISDVRFTLAMERGDVREAMGISFLTRLEKLVNELLAKPDCTDVFYIIYSAKWDEVNRKIREMWQVTDEKPRVHMLGQAIYEIHKSGHCECWALPLDIPVPDSELCSEQNLNMSAAALDNLHLSPVAYEKV